MCLQKHLTEIQELIHTELSVNHEGVQGVPGSSSSHPHCALCDLLSSSQLQILPWCCLNPLSVPGQGCQGSACLCLKARAHYFHLLKPIAENYAPHYSNRLPQKKQNVKRVSSLKIREARQRDVLFSLLNIV